MSLVYWAYTRDLVQSLTAATHHTYAYIIMYAYMMSDSSQTLCKIPLHSINLTHLILMDAID